MKKNIVFKNSRNFDVISLLVAGVSDAKIIKKTHITKRTLAAFKANYTRGAYAQF